MREASRLNHRRGRSHLVGFYAIMDRLAPGKVRELGALPGRLQALTPHQGRCARARQRWREASVGSGWRWLDQQGASSTSGCRIAPPGPLGPKPEGRQPCGCC